MCHSVEMYMPQMTRRAAEHRVGEADFAAAERERRAVDAGLGLIARLKRMVLGAPAQAAGSKAAEVSR